MKKNITVVSRGLVVDVGGFEKSHLDGWVRIYSKGGERIGGFESLDNKLRVIHKNKADDNVIYITYAIVDRRLKNNEY